jgi:diguanylate cyclase (GGDEF)-like protein
VFSAGRYILAVDDQGFSAVSWPADWRLIDSSSGLTGSVSAIRSSGDQIYVLTSSGIYRWNAERSRFQDLRWAEGEAWDLQAFADGSMLMADSYTIKHIRNDDVAIVDDDATARLLLQSRHDPDLVYAGTEFGIQLLRRFEDGWHSQVDYDDMGNIAVSALVERAPGELWIGSERGGIHRILLDEAGGRRASEPIGDTHGLHYVDKVNGAYVFEVNGELLATTDSGIFRFDGERFRPHSIADSDRVLVPGQTPDLATDGGQLWLFYHDRLFRLREGQEWVREDVSRLRKGALTIVEFIGERVLVGSMGRILVYDGSQAAAQRPGGQLKLTLAAVRDAGTELLLSLNDIVLSPTAERLSLNFALTDFDRPESVRYRTRLEPVEEDYSSWSDSGQQSFINLAPGDYRIHIEAIGSGSEPAHREFPIRVEPPWYEAAVLQVPGTLAALFAMFYFARYLGDRRARLLELENEALERRVAERTQELQSANWKLEQMAHSDGLTKIANRRRLDSYLENVHMQCAERGRVMAVAIFDVDYFKRYNDTHGHPAGDALLVELAQLLSQNLRRAEDMVARYGGEEFLLVMPGADEDTARAVVESMRRSVESSELGVTVSAGLYVTTPDAGSAADTLVTRADKALYRAKNGGRNQVVVAVD